MKLDFSIPRNDSACVVQMVSFRTKHERSENLIIMKIDFSIPRNDSACIKQMVSFRTKHARSEES